ncbi:acyclic terpene utilization AtuA family protein [uncultured Sphingomonas sp.]|uniref:acyclic terpene utilization AtuA family protein n=1 Tax=uncultured Sphingomonas sp. TaxID=158754 RepID=UPI002602E730|nr:acyclic terpene utilization AtuA family protein [uncultured Sphingomonas sp.]
MERVVRIGGATAAINDSGMGVLQFLRDDVQLDYMVFDLLAESVVGRLARQKLDDPQTGYVGAFVDRLVGPQLRHIRERGIRLIANAGGVNPRGCAQALQRKADQLGVPVRIAVVDGADMTPLLPALAGSAEMFGRGTLADGLAEAEPVLALTAYLGALPIAAALGRGADIVITGRIVDSATTLGALIHEFGWGTDDFDLLAAGTLVGHLIECSTQVTGGTFTDWREVPDWANIGYPIAECRPDGSAVITKPPGTGGVVSIGSVAEQLLYEVEDVAAYLVPDVACDFRAVGLRQEAPNRVEVTGARGRSRPTTYKACLTYEAGWRGVYAIPIIGPDAGERARMLGNALLQRTGEMLRQRNWSGWSRTAIEVIGADAAYGMNNPRSREVVARFAVEHNQREAVDLFLAEAAASLMVVAGATMPLTQQVIKVQHLRSALVDKKMLSPTVSIDGKTVAVAVPADGGFDSTAIAREAPPLPAPGEILAASVPLVALAWVRSGDKGDLFNLAVIARKPRFLPYLTAALPPEAIAERYAHLVEGAHHPVERQYAPGLSALNFVIRGTMGGGLAANIRFDSPGKGNGQQLLDFPIAVPAELAALLHEGTGPRGGLDHG